MSVLFQNRTNLLFQCMSTLQEIHESCGGIINHVDTYDPNSMDAFDTKTLEVNKKLQVLRREIKVYHENRMDQLESEEELRERAERLEIMLEWVKKDWKQMREIYQVDSEPKFFSYRRREPEYMKRRHQLLIDLESAIKMLNTKITMTGDSDDDSQIGSDQEHDTPQSKQKGQQQRDNSVKDKFDQEGDFLDIGDALRKQKAVRRQQDAQMREFNKEMEALKEKNQQINDGLDEGIKLLEGMNRKAEKLQNQIDKINKGLDKAQVAASGQVKFVIIALSVLFCTLVLAIGVIVAAVTIKPPGD